MIADTSVDVDARAVTVARAWADGTLTTEAALEFCADLVFRTGAPQQQAASATRQNPHLQDELTSRTLEFVVGKVYAGGFDLHRIAGGASLTGWARMLSRPYVTRQVRDMRALGFEATRDHDDPHRVIEAVTLASAVAPEDAAIDADFEALIHDLDQARLASRNPADDEDVLAARARALRALLDLPALVAPESLGERFTLRRICAEDPAAAWHALAERRDDVGGLLAAMFDDYSGEHIANLRAHAGAETGRAHQAAAMLVTEALHVPARPPRLTANALVRAVRRLSRQMGFADSAERLTSCWLAVSHTLIRCDDRRSSAQDKAALVLERAKHAEAFEQVLADHIAAFPASPLGDGGAQIVATLGRMLADVQASS